MRCISLRSMEVRSIGTSLVLAPASEHGEYLIPALVDEIVHLGLTILPYSAEARPDRGPDLGPSGFQFPVPTPEIDIRLVLDILLEEVDLETLDPVGQDRHTVLSDIEEQESEQVSGYEEGPEKDPLHLRWEGKIAGGNDIADAARTFDGLGEEHEGLARACRRGDGDRLIAETGGPKLRDALGKDGTVGLGHPQEDARPSAGTASSPIVARSSFTRRETRDSRETWNSALPL